MVWLTAARCHHVPGVHRLRVLQCLRLWLWLRGRVVVQLLLAVCVDEGSVVTTPGGGTGHLTVEHHRSSWCWQLSCRPHIVVRVPATTTNHAIRQRPCTRELLHPSLDCGVLVLRKLALQSTTERTTTHPRHLPRRRCRCQVNRRGCLPRTCLRRRHPCSQG